MPLKPILISFLTIFLVFLQELPSSKILETLGAGALVLMILYMVIQLIKASKGTLQTQPVQV